MRPVVLGCAVLILANASACSRNPPSPDPARGPAPREPALALAVPLAAPGPGVTTTSAKLQLATAVEEALDAGAAEAPSLSGKVVLHVGDSMVGGNLGLTKALDARFTGEGARFIRDYKVSESIVSYDKSPKLKDLLAKHHPDIVIITLGTNDVFVPYPAAMVQNVKNIAARVGARECYWIGPPTWKPDTGIVQVLRDNVAPCKFYDSSNLKLQRAGDGIHPTDRGGADWAQSFWTFYRPGSVSAPAAP
ncbi:MAG TPA: SGNH/GDSL hydrolase family protein [Labilithrix sp.]|nr:SGNH/GDSL hydrolase family protein [Labilithrix sp.]